MKMHTRKPSRLLLLSILLLSLTALFASEVFDEDADEIEELLALEEEEDSHQSPTGAPQSGAEVLSRAQRIVLELNTENSKTAIQQNEYVMVLGYAPWCGRSAELMPRFAEAATALKEQGSPLLMAKIDGERYPKAASALGVNGFPTLLLFINGSSQSYTGGFTSEEIVMWVKKKTGAPIIRVSSVVEASECVQKHSRFLVGLFTKFEGLEYEEFFKAAESDDEIQFIETSSVEVAKVLFPNVEQTKVFLGLTKNEPELYTPYDGIITREGILQFLDDNKFPLVTILTELNSAKVYAITNKLQVFVFAEAADLNHLAETLQGVARKFRSKIMLVLVDIREDNLAKPFLSLFGLEESENAVATAFDYRTNSKYLLESDLTPTNIEDFCLGLSAGKWSPFYKSKPIPDDKKLDSCRRNASVLTVVGKTFDDLILSNHQNILLEVYTPWCIDCDKIAKQVEKLAKHFKGMENLVFARIDASANEHPELQVEEYPALLFYTAEDKQNPIKFSTKSSSKELAALINKSLKEHAEVAKDEL